MKRFIFFFAFCCHFFVSAASAFTNNLPGLPVTVTNSFGGVTATTTATQVGETVVRFTTSISGSGSVGTSQIEWPGGGVTYSGPAYVDATAVLGRSYYFRFGSQGAPGTLVWTYSTTSAQTVTVSPSTAQIAQNGTVTLTASGGQNGYVWTVGSGGGQSITGTGSSVVFTATEGGTYTVGVYSPAGGGYAESNVADSVITVTDEQAYFIYVNETNRSKVDIRYRVSWKGTVISTFLLKPGENHQERFEVTDNTPAVIEWSVASAVLDDESGIWMRTDEIPTPVYKPGGEIHPVQQPVNTPNTPSTVVQTVVPGNETPGKDTTGNGSKGVWRSITNVNINSSVTAGQSAEGVEKIVGKLDELQDTMVGTPQDGSGFPSEAGEGSALPSSAEANAIDSTIEGLMPSGAVTLPTGVSQNGLWSISVPCPYIETLDFTMDLTRWSGAVAAFRAMLLGCECIVFFYVSISIIRGAFAS
jgi:hypothetical protein